jgi:hypothetical protein
VPNSLAANGRGEGISQSGIGEVPGIRREGQVRSRSYCVIIQSDLTRDL